MAEKEDVELGRVKVGIDVQTQNFKGTKRMSEIWRILGLQGFALTSSEAACLPELVPRHVLDAYQARAQAGSQRRLWQGEV